MDYGPLIHGIDAKVREQEAADPTGELLDEGDIVRKAIAKFPDRFHLRPYGDEVFRFSDDASYVGMNGTPMLYAQILRDEGWVDFAKGGPAAFRDHILPVKEVPDPIQHLVSLTLSGL